METYRYKCTECGYEMFGANLELCEECQHPLKRLDKVDLNVDPTGLPSRRVGPGGVFLDESDLEELAKDRKNAR